MAALASPLLGSAAGPLARVAANGAAEAVALAGRLLALAKHPTHRTPESSASATAPAPAPAAAATTVAATTAAAETLAAAQAWDRAVCAAERGRTAAALALALGRAGPVGAAEVRTRAYAGLIEAARVRELAGGLGSAPVPEDVLPGATR